MRQYGSGDVMPFEKLPLHPVRLRPHPHLYEVNTWAWLEQLSAQMGCSIKLAEVSDSEWDSLARRGFDIVWLMGVWQRSPESRRITLADQANFPVFDRVLPGWTPRDVVGSPYSVAQYVPDSRIGTWNDLDRVREKLHTRGMALFLDFVGNHTALDHPWVSEHPEFYVQGTQKDYEKDASRFYVAETSSEAHCIALGRDPYFLPWRDTAQLNHFQPAMRAAQIAELRTIAAHCDGVRCDMAMLHLSDIFSQIWSDLLKAARTPEKEFWSEAHEALPELILLAEAYWGTEQRLLDLGFSFSYDKELYDAVRDADIARVRARIGPGNPSQSRFARFLENHDEPRCAEVFGSQRLPASGTLMGTLPGMRFYHQGELEGRKIHFPITLRTAAPELPAPRIASLFEKILRLTNQDVFHRGEWNLLSVKPEGDATGGNLVVYQWRLEKSWKIIVVNLSAETSQGRLNLAGRVSPSLDYVFYDELNEVRYMRSGEELSGLGVFIRLEGSQAHLFDVSPA